MEIRIERPDEQLGLFAWIARSKIIDEWLLANAGQQPAWQWKTSDTIEIYDEEVATVFKLIFGV